MKVNHQYHLVELVEPGPLPIVTSFSLFVTAVGGILFMHNHLSGKVMFPLGVVLLLSSLFIFLEHKQVSSL